MSNDADFILLQRVEALWEPVKTAVRTKSAMLQALLHGVRPMDVEGDTVVLLCTSPFHKENLEKEANRSIVLYVMRCYIGENVNYRLTLESKSIEDKYRHIMESGVSARGRQQKEVTREDLEQILINVESEITRLREIIAVHKRHIQALELKEAKFGIHVPTYIIIEIDDLKHKVDEHKNEIENRKNELLKDVDMFVRSLAWRRGIANDNYTREVAMREGKIKSITDIGVEISKRIITLATEGVNIRNLLPRIATGNVKEGVEKELRELMFALDKESHILSSCTVEISRCAALMAGITSDYVFAIETANKLNDL